MNDELPALLEVFKNLPELVESEVEYRLYYNEDGTVLSMSSGDFPVEGKYIKIDKEIYDRPNYSTMRVINGKLTILENVSHHRNDLYRGGDRFLVVKGHANILVDDTYQGETETYGFKNH
jgi:hypothetical protein